MNAIARNEFYTGDFLYQKYFTDENYKKCRNTGQLDQYLNEDHHPAIIDHETFEKANAMIREHGEERGRKKAAGEIKRYVFSGRLRCGCCGGHMRRGKDTRVYYACGNHLVKRTVRLAGKAQGICPMLPVFEQDVKNAFATTLNRMAAEPSILASHDTAKEDAEEKISLEARLESVKRRKSLLHDRALAERYTAGLREKKAALDMEEKEITDRMAQLERKSPVAELKRAVNRRSIKEAYTEADEKLFKTFVDHAVLWSKEKAQFYFTCGLVLEEDMHIVKEGKTYIELPVRTVFEENTTL